jgi:hypothetical protein
MLNWCVGLKIQKFASLASNVVYEDNNGYYGFGYRYGRFDCGY